MRGAIIINVAQGLIDQNDELKVKCLVSLASQTYGATPISKIGTKIHVIHDDKDKYLSVNCAYTLKSWAKNLGEFIILKDANHWMEECYPELREAVYNIILGEFSISH